MSFIHQHLEEVVSTNRTLSKLSENKELPDFYTISADYQSGGKGYHGANWHSTKGCNILMSIVVYPSFLKAADAFLISSWVSVSLLEYLQYHSIRDISIKWPNDIYVGKQKIAGILINNTISDSAIRKSIIGIGLNINQKEFPDYLPNPVSLVQQIKTECVIKKEIERLVVYLQKQYNLLMDSHQKLRDRYHSKIFQLNKWAAYSIENELVRAKIIGVDDLGQLGLQFENGKSSYFEMKSIKFILE